MTEVERFLNRLQMFVRAWIFRQHRLSTLFETRRQNICTSMVLHQASCKREISLPNKQNLVPHPKRHYLLLLLLLLLLPLSLLLLLLLQLLLQLLPLFSGKLDLIWGGGIRRIWSVLRFARSLFLLASFVSLGFWRVEFQTASFAPSFTTNLVLF
jgi:hypothetical protein